MSDPVKVVLGLSLEHEGHEYVVCYVQAAHDLRGRSLRVECSDPLLAQQHMMDQERQREAVAMQLQALRDITETHGDGPKD